MIFFGHKFIPSEHFYHVQSIDAINNTPSNSIIITKFSEDNLDIVNHAIANEVRLALHVESVKEIVYAAALGASYLVVPKQEVKTAQNLADNYLFDAKILVSIENEDEVEELALLGIDGVICSNAIIKINS